MPTSRVKPVPATLSPFWWTPLAFIALALVIVFTVPFIASGRLQDIRMFTAEFLSPALVRTNDLEAGLATDFAARSELAELGGQSSAAAAAESSARIAISEDEHELDSLVRHAGIEEITLFAEARASIAAWRREEEAFAAKARDKTALRGRGDAGTRGLRWDALQRALADLQKLEDALTRHTASDRAQIMGLERFSVIVPGGVVPLALLALVAVAWTARKTVMLSQAATAGQRNAEMAMASKSALMRGVTHDLKNPLGAARGYADLLADGELGPLPEAQTRMIRRLRSLLTSTLDTVDDLVELSRAEAGALPIDRSECDLAILARELLDDFRLSGDAAGLQLSFVLAVPTDGAIPSVMTDPARVRQVLGNLLSNAVKYTPRGGRVEMRVSMMTDDELGSVVAFEVCDTGAGIPDYLHERVFEEFFRVPATVAMAPGTGVGLAIARRVARLLGGDLRVCGTDGGGATFSLLIPETGRLA